jgi:hypothetical protein
MGALLQDVTEGGKGVQQESMSVSLAIPHAYRCIGL